MMVKAIYYNNRK